MVLVHGEIFIATMSARVSCLSRAADPEVAWRMVIVALSVGPRFDQLLVQMFGKRLQNYSL